MQCNPNDNAHDRAVGNPMYRIQCMESNGSIQSTSISTMQSQSNPLSQRIQQSQCGTSPCQSTSVNRPPTQWISISMDARQHVRHNEMQCVTPNTPIHTITRPIRWRCFGDSHCDSRARVSRLGCIIISYHCGIPKCFLSIKHVVHYRDCD